MGNTHVNNSEKIICQLIAFTVQSAMIGYAMCSRLRFRRYSMIILWRIDPCYYVLVLELFLIKAKLKWSRSFYIWTPRFAIANLVSWRYFLKICTKFYVTRFQLSACKLGCPTILSIQHVKNLCIQHVQNLNAQISFQCVGDFLFGCVYSTRTIQHYEIINRINNKIKRDNT